MTQVAEVRHPVRPGAIPWALRIQAISREEPGQIVRSLTGAILGSGGWVLGRSISDRLVDILFEFERESCPEIYTILIAAGIELSQNAHLRLTELCQCTRMCRQGCGNEIVSVELEVQTAKRALPVI